MLEINSHLTEEDSSVLLELVLKCGHVLNVFVKDVSSKKLSFCFALTPVLTSNSA